jgi:hypothetical protein
MPVIEPRSHIRNSVSGELPFQQKGCCSTLDGLGGLVPEVLGFFGHLGERNVLESGPEQTGRNDAEESREGETPQARAASCGTSKSRCMVCCSTSTCVNQEMTGTGTTEPTRLAAIRMTERPSVIKARIGDTTKARTVMR